MGKKVVVGTQGRREARERVAMLLECVFTCEGGKELVGTIGMSYPIISIPKVESGFG